LKEDDEDKEMKDRSRNSSKSRKENDDEEMNEDDNIKAQKVGVHQEKYSRFKGYLRGVTINKSAD